MALNDDDKQWFAEQLGVVRAEFAEKLERVETNLLTEFHKWSSPVELRMKSHATAMRAFDLEMEALTERIKNLESGNPRSGTI